MALFPEGGSILEKNRIEGVSDYLYEGDINLTEEQLAALESVLSNRTTRQKRQASKVYPIWTNKKVFYYFEANFGESMKALVKKTLAYLAARTCLTFVESATAANRIQVFSGSGCYSNIGMSGGEQGLSLGSGCNTMGIIAHEFMHALGIFHTQSRHDRDSFITVDLTNVPETSDEDGTMPGDIVSIIKVNEKAGIDRHLFDGDILLGNTDLRTLTNTPKGGARQKRQVVYDSNKWPNNKVFYYFDSTIPPANQAYIRTVLNYLSARTCIDFVVDATAPNRIKVLDGAGCYSSVGMRGGEQVISLSSDCIIIGTIAHQFMESLGAAHTHQRFDRNDSIIVDLTNVPPPACGATLTATTTWVTRKVTVGDPKITTTSSTYKMCTDWVKAPAGKKVQIRVTALQGVNCTNGCWVHAIEPKIDTDKRLTNARICCPAQLNSILPSRINPTPIVFYSIRRAATFTYQYRYVNQ
ncbi:unnamed protein product [Haemonchus placei]|uniref:Zinc metalloproteinase n=1 Tax=Haemonchus placei TaxID=6290 RepID=A0A0N4WSQ6_HAEPC|nr:unnamed protein product [Haemonchus placei]